MRGQFFAVASVLVAGLASGVSATVIQFNLEGSGTVYTSYPSPAYTAGDTTAAATTWNGVSADSSSLVYSDGSAATGVSIDLGAYIVKNTDRTLTVPYTDPTGVQDWNYTLTSYNYNALNAYAQNALAQNMLYTGPGGSVAARIKGLAAGTYRVYATAMIDEAGAGAYDRSYDEYIGANLTGTYNNPSTHVGPTHGATAWVAGKNYAVSTVTIGSPNDYITVISTSAAYNVVLNGIQIVSIPEPASLSLLALGGLALLRRRR